MITDEAAADKWLDNYDDSCLDVEKDYTKYGIIKAGYQVTVSYPYTINNPEAFVSKCFGDNFSTPDGTYPDDMITIRCNSWLWADTGWSVGEIDWPKEDIPNIFDNAKIISIDYYEAD